MARTDPHFKLRIPPDLLAELKDIAESNGRSVTAEIVQRLRHSLLDREMKLKVNKFPKYGTTATLPGFSFPEEVEEKDEERYSYIAERLEKLSDEQLDVMVALLEQIKDVIKK